MTQTIERSDHEVSSRTRLDWQPIAILVAFALAVLTGMHLLGGSSDSKWVEVAHGSRHGVYWQLDVAEKNGQPASGRLRHALGTLVDRAIPAQRVATDE